MTQALNNLSKSELFWARMHHLPDHFRDSSAQRRNLTRGIAAGALAGLAAGWVMVRFQNLWTGMENRLHASAGKSQPKTEADPSTVKAAKKISQGILGHQLSDGEKRLAGPAVHYGFSAASGALYGMAAEISPQVTRGQGLPFGTVLFVAADEVALPASGLSPKAGDVPLSKHIYGLASHLVFGLATELARRLIRTDRRHR